MHSYQRMPNPANESSPPDGQFRCLRMLLCFRHRRSSDKEAIDRFVGKNFQDEQKPVLDDDGPPTEDSSDASKPEKAGHDSERAAKKSMFTIPKRFPKLKLRKGMKKEVQNTSTATSISVSSAPKTIKSPPSSKTRPAPKNLDLALPAEQNDRGSLSSNRTAKSGQLTKVTSPSTPPPRETGVLRGNSPTMDESSVASVDAYIAKEYMPVTSIDTFLVKNKERKQSEQVTRVPDDDEGSMVSILTMDPTLQAISRREAELGPVAAKALYKPKKSKKKQRSSEPPGMMMPRNDSSMLEDTMMRMTNPYDGGSIVEGEHEDDGSDDYSDALSEIAPLDLISL